jgi:hypothetical protein
MKSVRYFSHVKGKERPVDDEVDEFLAHYGVVGMKWGKRKGGLKERVKGAHADSLQRRIEANKAVAEGRGQIRDYAGTFARKGVALTKGAARGQVKALEARKDRVEKGKAKFFDKLDVLGNVGVADLVVSRQDKRGLDGAKIDKVNSGAAKAGKILAAAATVTVASMAANYAKSAAKSAAASGANKAFNAAYEKKKAQNNYTRNKASYERSADTRGIANYSTVRMNYDAATDSWN